MEVGEYTQAEETLCCAAKLTPHDAAVRRELEKARVKLGRVRKKEKQVERETFGGMFDQLAGFFHISTVDGSGLTPASLRAGGATFWYQLTDSTEWVRFRGRWMNTRMLEIYIQEVAATGFMHTLSEDVQTSIHFVASAAPVLLETCCAAAISESAATSN